MAKKKKQPATDAPAAAPKADDTTAIAQRVFEKGDMSTVRKLLPKLRAEGHAAEADALFDRVKIDPVQLAVGLGAAVIALLVALLTLK